MGPGRSSHGDDLQFVIAEELVNVAERLGSELLCELLRGFGPEVEDGVQFSTRHGLDGLPVELADHAGPDDSEFHEEVGVRVG